MLKARIDIGSNSALLLISEYKNGSFIDFESKSRITSLGHELDKNKVFSEKSMQDTFLALVEYKKIIKKYDLDLNDVIVTATEASRVAGNSKGFFLEIKQKLGFSISIINSVGEAYYTAKGVTYGADLDDKEVIIMDIGGASTELIKIQVSPFKVTETISLPVGSVRANDWIKEGLFQEKMEKSLTSFDMDKYKTKNMIAVAGTMTALGAMLLGLSNFKESSVNDSQINFNKFCNFLDKIKELSTKELSSQYPFLGKRSSSIIAGARIARAFGLLLDVENFKISTLGLRYGTLIDDIIEKEFLN